ncbi:MAG: hypothetical protein NZ529_06590, partial [Cytophagaceae bacterium]|nr:hypothetical protein [Cytophagaceae bacterium]MDW8456447.1 hypothetical protein [Cytophagaceae bacterium]
MLPPFVGVAVNVTIVPAHISLSASSDTILTLTGRFGCTVIVIPFDSAGLPTAHTAFDVSSTSTTSPSFNPLVLYTDEFVPTF